MISVIMLTYNREQLVGRAIESILNQTYRDFEFIIVDNGSTDHSGIIAENYAKQDARIQVVHIPKSNIGTGRNVGLDKAVGEYVTFIDDDDWVEVDFLEFLYQLLIGSQADISICGTNLKFMNEKTLMTAEESIIELMWRKKYNVGFPTKMLRAELMRELRFSEVEQYDDIGLMYKLLANAKKIAYWGLPKYNVYRHEDNNSAWTTNHALLNAKILDEYLTVYRKRTEWLSERFPHKAPVFRYFEWSFMISMLEKIVRLQIVDCEIQKEKIKKVLLKNQDEILTCEWILNFERDWVKKYVFSK